MLTAGPIDEVSVVDEEGQPTGTASKVAVHGPQTPLHLDFSSYLMNLCGAVRVTRRTLCKTTWPRAWTDALCGHPRASASLPDVVCRRAIDTSGVLEKVCPIYSASASDQMHARPLDVTDYSWVRPTSQGRSLRLAPWAFSPQMVLPARLLPLLGGSGQQDPDLPEPQPEQVLQ